MLARHALVRMKCDLRCVLLTLLRGVVVMPSTLPPVAEAVCLEIEFREFVMAESGG